jgi:phosphatidylinositol 3-kinase
MYEVTKFLLFISHLDNLLQTDDGRMFHVDFASIPSRDPKPFTLPMKLCKEMVEAMGGVER